MPRARKNTIAINCRVDGDLIVKLQSISPSLCTRDLNTQEIKFRHGALGRYIERLIREDIERRSDVPTAIETLLGEADREQQR